MGSMVSSITGLFSGKKSANVPQNAGGGKSSGKSGGQSGGNSQSGGDGQESSTLEKALMAAAIGLPLLGSGVSLLSGFFQDDSNKKFAKFQKRQAEADAFANLGVAKVQAKQIRENAKKAVQGVSSQEAASGVTVGGGAGDDAMRSALEAGFYDANITMANANDEFLRSFQKIRYDSIVNKQTRKAERINKVASLLSFGGEGFAAIGKWKKAFGNDTGSTQDSPLSIKTTKG